MKKLYLLLMILISFNCHSEVSVSVIKSYHSGGGDYNEEHVATSYHSKRSGFYAAYLHSNSYGDPALIAGYLFQKNQKYLGVIRPEVFVGGVYGYKEHIHASFAGISPYAWVGAKIDTPWKNMYFRVRGIPGVYTFAVERVLW